MNPAGADDTEQVMIRVRNATGEDLDRVTVSFPERRVDYGAVAKGASSGFHETGRAYRYAGIEVTAGGRDLSLLPIDYVGEQALTPGRYTYVLGLEDGRLTIALEKAE